MAVVNTLDVIVNDNVVRLFDNKIIQWSKFKNTPASLMSGQGHNHDSLYMRSPKVNSLFKTESDKVDALALRIEVIGYKDNLLMVGGIKFNDNILRNYNLNTEVTSTQNNRCTFNILEGSSLSYQRFGYFLNNNKKINKYDYFTATCTFKNDTDIVIKNTLVDFAVQSKGFIFDGISKVRLQNILLDTFSTKVDFNHSGNFRNGLNSFTYGFLKGPSSTSGKDSLKKYNYSSDTNENMMDFNLGGNVSTLNKNNNKGFYTGVFNYEMNYLTETVSRIYGNSNQNSNNITSELFGTLIAGGNTNVTRLTWSTNSFTVQTPVSSDTTLASSVEI